MNKWLIIVLLILSSFIIAKLLLKNYSPIVPEPVPPTAQQELPNNPNINPNENDGEEASPEKLLIPTTYSEALVYAKKHHLKLVLLFHAEWCRPCQDMKRDTLSNPAVKKALAYYLVVDLDADQNREMMQKFKITGIPAYLIIDPDEHVLRKGEGYKGPQEFSAWLTKTIRD